MPPHLYVWGYTSGCPSCTSLVDLLTTLNIPFTFHAIDPKGPERSSLKDAGFLTVPQVFTREGVHVGDWSDLRRGCLSAIETLLPPLRGVNDINGL
jgi:glutaredoxin